MEPLIETWQIAARLCLYLLEAIPPEQMATPLAKGKTVEGGFSHIHSVRLMWLKVCAPDLHATLTKPEPGAPKEEIAAALAASAEAMEEVFRRAGSPEGKVKGFKPHAADFLGYLIAHEAFHRAQIELALRQAGTPLDDRVAYGLWEWGVR